MKKRYIVIIVIAVIIGYMIINSMDPVEVVRSHSTGYGTF